MSDESAPPAEPPREAGEITSLLLSWGDGDAAAAERLLPLVYGSLRRQAAAYLSRERPGHTLVPTALAHEAYLRLVDQSRVTWRSRGHFFAVAAQAMRRVLVDHARAQAAEKRGGASPRLTLSAAFETPAANAAASKGIDVLDLDGALERLASLSAVQARIVELRFFAGLTIEETAASLGISPATVKRDWAMARAFLKRELSP